MSFFNPILVQQCHIDKGRRVAFVRTDTNVIIGYNREQALQYLEDSGIRRYKIEPGYDLTPMVGHMEFFCSYCGTRRESRNQEFCLNCGGEFKNEVW